MLMHLPNFITVSRLLLVPVTVWFILSGFFTGAFITFVLAGVGDGLDGYLARRFSLQSELGGYLDPIADKVLLISIFVTLAILGHTPAWLAILVVTRDFLIVGAVIVAWLLSRPLVMKPSWISKCNTVGQIVFAGSVLAALGWLPWLIDILPYCAVAVAVLTVASGGLYMHYWFGHMTR